MKTISKLFTTHILSSFVLLIVLSSILFFIKDFLKDIVFNPPISFLTNLSIQEFIFYIILVLLIILIVLISFIFYLLLTYNTRFQMEIEYATKDLAFSKQQFKSLYDNAPVPYLMLDKDGNIHEPNKATLRFFEVHEEDILNKNLFSFIVGEDKEKAEDLFRYYKSNLSINRKEIEMITKNNNIKSVMLSIFDMRGPGSKFREGLATIVDITEQKLIEKAKTEFLSLASHQLKTPLVTAKWYSEALISDEGKTLTPEQKEYVKVLHNANQNMIEIVDVLLNISRIEMGSMKLDKIDTNVRDLVESVLNELSLQINNKKIKIEKNYNDLFLSEKTDPKLLRVIIQNLISNSVKYTGENGIISINFEEINNEKRITVKDNGVGIPKEQQDRVFSKLFRADNVQKMSSSQGTGLGLYLVKSIAVSMGGDIRFKSEENKGSAFTIIF